MEITSAKGGFHDPLTTIISGTLHSTFLVMFAKYSVLNTVGQEKKNNGLICFIYSKLIFVV